MNKLENREMSNVKGGGSLSVSSAINAISKVVSTIFSVGQAIGSSIRRIRAGSYCSY